MDLRETYDRIARDWHADHHDDTWWIEGTNTFVNLLPNGGDVLDVGCGAGAKSRYLVDKGLHVTGIDFSKEMIAIAREEVPGVDFKVLDMREVETLNKTFDGVFAQASLLHIPRSEAGGVVADLVQVVRPQGYIYIAVKEPWPGTPAEEIKTENDYGYTYERFFSYFTKEEIEEHVRNAGCDIVYSTVSTVGKTNWAQVIGQRQT